MLILAKNAEIMLLILLTSSNLVKTGKYLCNRQMTGQKKVTAMHDQWMTILCCKTSQKRGVFFFQKIDENYAFNDLC